MNTVGTFEEQKASVNKYKLKCTSRYLFHYGLLSLMVVVIGVHFSGQKLPMDKIYHSLNRTILYQLSRPLASLTGDVNTLQLKLFCISHVKFYVILQSLTIETLCVCLISLLTKTNKNYKMISLLAP